MSTFEQYIPSIIRTTKKFGATNVRIFGSFSNSSQTPSSDIDLLVDLEPGRDLLDLIAIKQELEEQTGRKIDILTENSLNLHLKQKIISKAQHI